MLNSFLIIRRNHLYTVVILQTILFVSGAYAQITGHLNELGLKLKQPFIVTQFSTIDGLPQNQVIKIIPKKDNSLIIYTANGIANFNGYEFKSVITNENYKKQFFTQLEYCPRSDKLFGIDKQKKLIFLAPDYKEIKIDNEIPFSFFREGDSLFVLTQSKNIYLLNVKTLSSRLLLSSSELGADFFLPTPQAFIYNNKRFYFGGSAGLFTYDLALNKGLKQSEVIFIKFETNPFNRSLYGITTDNIYSVGEKVEEIPGMKLKKEHARYFDLEFISENYFFAASNQGLFFIQSENIKLFTKEDGLFSNDVQSLYYDSIQNCLFAGTAERGLLKVFFKTNYNFSIEQGLSASSLNSIVHTQDGKIILGQNCCNLKEVTGDTIVNYGTIKAFFSSLSEIDGLLYAGTWGNGVKIIKNGFQVDSLKPPDQLPNEFVHAIFKDSKGNIWVGTDRGIAMGRKPHEIKPYLVKEIKETVICFYELKNGTICLGVEGGIYMLNENRGIKFIGTIQGFKGKEVRAFYEDMEGKLWFGSYDGGIYCYEKNKLTHINSIKGCMLDRDAFTLAKDNFGYLYTSSNRGLWRISERALNDFYKGKINYLIPFLYNEQAGILNTEFNGGFQNNCLVTPRNHIYFPSIEGLVVTIPENLKPSKLTASIDKVVVNDTLISTNDTVFRPGTFSVQFDFSTTNFLLSKNIHFQHKLIGIRTYDWSIPQKARSVYFKMLPPGKYKFLVRVLDGFNDPNPKETVYSFEIKPFFYETVWFRVLIFILIVWLIFYLINRRSIEFRSKEKREEEYNRKVAEIELKAIQAQLNPHFIFNCLNTIKFFILERNFEDANKSLNKFSSLIRDSLENSDKLFIEFSQEVKFINNYVELEKLRMKDLLEYTTEIDPAINPYTVIPRLLIQPYVENAIKHGISNLEHRAGKLLIKFEKNESNLICTIIDNGIGRKASRTLSNKTGLHISKGTQLTVEKTAFLKQYNNYNCRIEITDLLDKNGKPDGTRVIILIPL